MNPRCDWVNCSHEASNWVKAQWSIADFGEWYACNSHVGTLHDWLVKRLVDGQEIAEISWHFIE
jgi:hypothetical protein